MKKTVVIIGSETLLGRKLIEVYLNSAYQVIAPVMTSQESLKGSERANLFIVPWNRSSLVSAKTVIREICRNFKTLDKILIVNPELTNASRLEEMETETLDEALYSATHGTLYLIKELLKVISSQDNRAVLAFAETEKGQQSEALIPLMIQGAFHNMAEALLLAGDDHSLRCGFTSRLTEMEDYAQFIKGILETEDPKINKEWLLFSEKKNLFQSLPVIKRK